MSLELIPGSDILDEYRKISRKLNKRRFLRKPNVTEACEAYVSLGQQCESLELPAYAGLCWIAAARCEGSLTNIPGETSCLIRSARQFLQAEQLDFNLGCSNPCSENLQAALSCYSHASTRFNQNCPIKIGLDLEIVDFLRRIDRPEYIEGYLNDASELAKDRSGTQIYCLELLCAYFIDCGDFVAALETCTEITGLLENLPLTGARSDVLLKCELNAVLLLLILRPNPQKLSPNLAKLLEKYTWSDRTDKTLLACKMSEKMYLLIQSLVILCQSLDASGLIDLEGEFWPLLSKQQKELLRTLVKTYYP